MDKSVGMAQAKSKLSELVGQVVYGNKRFILERHGKPVAVLLGTKEYKRLRELEQRIRQGPLPPELRQHQEQVAAEARRLREEMGDPVDQLSELLSRLPAQDDPFWIQVEEAR